MTYGLEYTDIAIGHLIRLRKDEPKAYKKAQQLLEEIKKNPTTGTGKPEPLKGDRAGQWSRRISSKHRLVYKIEEQRIVVLVLTAYGHYNDK